LSNYGDFRKLLAHFFHQNPKMLDFFGLPKTNFYSIGEISPKKKGKLKN
jgi:hypothetical protein